jgi:Ca2+-binding EF-hand superfamily protein
MQGLLVLESMAEAIAKGFEFFDRTSDGYIVRKKTSVGYMLALVRK